MKFDPPDPAATLISRSSDPFGVTVGVVIVVVAPEMAEADTIEDAFAP